MKTPASFFKPLAIGAPDPLRELPVTLERTIHFLPPHIEKIRAKAAQIAKTVDVLLGNLEDAIPIEAKEAARKGFIEVASAVDFGQTGKLRLPVQSRRLLVVVLNFLELGIDHAVICSPATGIAALRARVAFGTCLLVSLLSHGRRCFGKRLGLRLEVGLVLVF